MGNFGQGLQGGASGAAAGSAGGPWGAGIGGGLGFLSGLFGGNNPTASQAVPSQLQPLQNSQLAMIQQMLSGTGMPGGALGGISSAFGNLGVPQTDLQRQSAGGISQFLNQPNPQMQALNTAMPALQEILTPGSMNPQFAQDLAMANQGGARFGSANAIMRGQAFTNLFNQRNAAAQTLGMLGQKAGNATMNNLIGGFGIGQQQAQQGDVGLQRLLSLFGGFTGLRQQLLEGLPIKQQPSTTQQLGTGIGGLAALFPHLFGGSGVKDPGMPDFRGISVPNATMPPIPSLQ